MKRTSVFFDCFEQAIHTSAAVFRCSSCFLVVFVSLLSVSLAFCREKQENPPRKVQNTEKETEKEKEPESENEAENAKNLEKNVETFDLAVAAQREGVIKAIALSTKRIPLPAGKSWTLTGNLSPDGTKLITGSLEEDSTARVYDLTTQRLLGEMKHGSFVTAAFFHPTKPVIYTADTNDAIHCWNATTYQKNGDHSPLPGIGIFALAISPKGNCGVAGTNLGRVISWNLKNGKKIKEFAHHHKEKISCMDFSPDGKTFATGSEDGSVCFWRIDQSEPLKVIPNAGKEAIGQIGFNDDGSQIVVCSQWHDPYVHVYDVKSGEEVANYGGYVAPRSLTSAGFSPDGKYIATGDREYVVVVWDVQTKKPVWADHRLAGNHVYRTIFTPKQDFLIVLSGFQALMFEMPKSLAIPKK